MLNCLAQRQSSARLTVVVLDDVGNLREFSVLKVQSASNAEIRLSKGYESVHSLTATIGDQLDFEFIVKGFERSPIRQLRNLVKVDGSVIVLRASLYLSDLGPDARHSPRVIVLPSNLCSTSNAKWLEVKKVGGGEVDVIAGITGCRGRVGTLHRGLYSALLHENGHPIAVGLFVVGAGGAEQEEVRFSTILP